MRYSMRRVLLGAAMAVAMFEACNSGLVQPGASSGGASGTSGSGGGSPGDGPAGGSAGTAGAGAGGSVGGAGVGAAGLGGGTVGGGGATGLGGGSGTAGSGVVAKKVSFGPFIPSPTPMQLGQAGAGPGQQWTVFYSDSLVVDLDQDGKLDWAGITSPWVDAVIPCSLATMRGHGDGTFGPDLFFVIHATGACSALFTADLLGDGKRSVVFTGGSPSTHVVTTKDGKTFAETQSILPECRWAADLTGDGRDELLCREWAGGTNVKALVMALNDGKGVLSAGTSVPFPNGSSFFGAAFPRGAPPPSPQVGLFSLPSTMAQAQNGALTLAASSLPAAVGAADLFATGHSQLVGEEGVLWDLSPDLSTATKLADLYPLGFDTVDFGDVDGDGRLDILFTQSGSAQSMIQRQNADKTFTKVWSGGGYLRFGDVNGDGLADLVNRTNIAVALNTTK